MTIGSDVVWVALEGEDLRPVYNHMLENGGLQSLFQRSAEVLPPQQRNGYPWGALAQKHVSSPDHKGRIPITVVQYLLQCRSRLASGSSPKALNGSGNGSAPADSKLLESLRRQLQEKSEQIQQLERDKNTATEQANRLDRQLTSLQRENTQLRESQNASQRALAEKQQELDRMREELQQTRKPAEDSEVRPAASSDEVAQLRAEVARLEDINSELGDSVLSWSERAQAAEEALTAAHLHVEKVEAQADEVQASTEAMVSELIEVLQRHGAVACPEPAET